MHIVIEDDDNLSKDLNLNNNLSKDSDSTNPSTTSNTEFKDYIIRQPPPIHLKATWKPTLLRRSHKWDMHANL